TLLVEGLIQVSAFRRLDAGRTTMFAWAALEHSRRVGDPALERAEAARGNSDAAGVAVVDEDRRRSGLEVQVRGETADVPAVAHRPERKERDQGGLSRGQRAEQPGHLLEAGEQLGRRREPDRLCLELGLWKLERHGLDRLPVLALALVGDDLLSDRHHPEVELDTEAALGSGCMEYRRHRVLLRLCVLVPDERLDERRAGFVIELQHPV